MSPLPNRLDVEKNRTESNNSNTTTTEHVHRPSSKIQTNIQPFIGRLGGNQEFILDRDDASNAALIKSIPDSAPSMTLTDQFDLNGFRCLGLWKSAMMEGVGLSSSFPPMSYIDLQNVRQCSST